MFGNIMGKLQEVKQKSEDIKKRLEKMSVVGEAENGLVKVVSSGNRKILSIEISPEIFNDKEQVEELTLLAVNRALEKAEKLAENEMQGVAKDFLPGI